MIKSERNVLRMLEFVSVNKYVQSVQISWEVDDGGI